jgi:Protein of unknown function (DUF541)
MQMVKHPWGVTTYGAASVKAQPDLVRARFRIVRLEQTPAQAFATVSDTVHAVRGVLRQHAVPDSAVQRSRLDLGIPGPGLDTGRLATQSTPITKNTLRPGDLLINPAAGSAGHVVIFERWTDTTMNRYLGYEQSADGGTHHRTIPYPYFGDYQLSPYRFETGVTAGQRQNPRNGRIPCLHEILLLTNLPTRMAADYTRVVDRLFARTASQ